MITLIIFAILWLIDIIGYFIIISKNEEFASVVTWKRYFVPFIWIWFIITHKSNNQYIRTLQKAWDSLEKSKIKIIEILENNSSVIDRQYLKDAYFNIQKYQKLIERIMLQHQLNTVKT